MSLEDMQRDAEALANRATSTAPQSEAAHRSATTRSLNRASMRQLQGFFLPGRHNGSYRALIANRSLPEEAGDPVTTARDRGCLLCVGQRQFGSELDKRLSDPRPS
jgi:hypothetical protein